MIQHVPFLIFSAQFKIDFTHCRRRGLSARPSIRRSWHCAGSGLASKYKDRLGAHIGDGVATRMKPGNTCTTTVFHRGCQQPSSENGFENWVCTFECPPDLAIGLRLCLYFITFWLLSYFIVIVIGTHFTFIFTNFAH